MSPSSKSPEHQLGVGAADPGQDRPGDHPVGMDRPGVVQVVEAEGQRGEVLLQLVGRDRAGLVAFGAGPEHEGLHEPRPVRAGRPPSGRPWTACRPRTRRSPGLHLHHGAHVGNVVLEPVAATTQATMPVGHLLGRRQRARVVGRVVAGLVPDLGVDGPGQDQADRHAGARQVGGQRLAPAGQGELGGAVGRLGGDARAGRPRLDTLTMVPEPRSSSRGSRARVMATGER